MSDKSVRKLLAAVLAAAASLNGASHVQALPTMPIHDPHMTNQDVWATIDRLNRHNPTAYLKVSVAREAGRSELIAAIVQAASSAVSADDVAAAVEAAVLRIGGINSRNIMSLADLLKALRALGLPESTIVATLNAYSAQVAEAVESGRVSATLAAAVLTDKSQDKLYG